MARAVWGVSIVLPALLLPLLSADERTAPQRWGSDHVGKPLPDFTSGDECLFCHREVGPGWAENRHGRTIRFADASNPALQALRDDGNLAPLADDVQYLMGDRRRQRYLKSADTHGRLELLSVAWAPTTNGEAGRLLHQGEARWTTETFAADCAGCHTTAVDATTRQFAAVSLDCFVCHGVIPEDHTEQPALARFSSERPASPREEMSVCGQCHLRGGRSRSSGLPYPNNFVAGDNLLLDYEVDLSAEALSRANPLDGHILENVRDVVVHGEESVTCLTCHDVHEQSTRRHRRLRSADLCLHCHHADGPKRMLKDYEAHSTTCDY